MAGAGRCAIEVARTFPFAEVAQAHRVGEAGAVCGKLVLLVDSPALSGGSHKRGVGASVTRSATGLGPARSAMLSTAADRASG